MVFFLPIGWLYISPSPPIFRETDTTIDPGSTASKITPQTEVKIQDVEGAQKFATEFPRIRDDRVGLRVPWLWPKWWKTVATWPLMVLWYVFLLLIFFACMISEKWYRTVWYCILTNYSTLDLILKTRIYITICQGRSILPRILGNLRTGWRTGG